MGRTKTTGHLNSLLEVYHSIATFGMIGLNMSMEKTIKEAQAKA
jgi:hypothetical protein